MKIILFIFSSLLLWSCSSSDDDVQSPVQPQEEQPATDGGHVDASVIELSAVQKQAVDKNNDFAFSFFRTVSTSAENMVKSVFMSPLSLTYALGMLNAGATGQTSAEITSMLGFGQDGRESVNALCRQLIEQAPAVDSSVTLHLADLVASDKYLTLASQYRQAVLENYHAEAVSLDFSSAASVKYINDWCSKHTEGMIPSIVEDLSNTKLALLNAVYFKAPWSGKFDVAETRQEPFHKEDGTQAQLPMMHRVGPAYLANGDGYTTLGLPYGNGKNWTMYVLLPDEGKSIDDVIASLDGTSWNKTLQAASIAAIDVDVKLPRFKAENTFSLNGILQQMGATSMFMSRNELVDMTEERANLSVSSVLQKSAIEVTEEGTEASAVTVVHMYATSGNSDDAMPIFHATRPFVYLIQEKTSGAVFFIGVFRG